MQKFQSTHILETDHSILWEGVKILAYETDWRKRKIKEGIFIDKARGHTLNSSSGVPPEIPNILYFRSTCVRSTGKSLIHDCCIYNITIDKLTVDARFLYCFNIYRSSIAPVVQSSTQALQHTPHHTVYMHSTSLSLIHVLMRAPICH